MSARVPCHLGFSSTQQVDLDPAVTINALDALLSGEYSSKSPSLRCDVETNIPTAAHLYRDAV